MPDVPAIFVDNAFAAGLAAGSVQWTAVGAQSYVRFTCPCGCGVVHSIPVRLASEKDATERQNAWIWDGNADKPSLSPSIFCKTTCRWHGYLTDGVFKAT